MKNFCLDLKEHVTKIMNYEKKKKRYHKQKKERTGITCKKFVIYVKKYLVLIITIKFIIK